MHSLFTWLDAATDVSETIADAAENAENLGMDLTGMMDYLMMVLLFGLGLYMIYTIIKLKRECILFDSKILYPGGCNKDDCVDPDGFIDYISPRMLISGIALILCGALTAAVKWIPGFGNKVTSILELVLPLFVVVWYVFISKKAAKTYWGS